MTLYHYMMLSEQEQIHHLVTRGEHVMTLDKDNSRFALYALGQFFIEIEHAKFSPEIIGRAIFKTGLRLDKYLGDFNYSNIN